MRKRREAEPAHPGERCRSEMLANELLGGIALPLPIIVLRLVGATILCALIGYEREASEHSAGLRTNMLVGLASASFALIALSISTPPAVMRSAWTPYASLRQ